MNLTLDAGALIALERGDREVVLTIRRALDNNDAIFLPAGVIAQVWRDGRRQAILARLFGAPQTTVVSLNDARARAAGQLCGIRGTSDVVDATVALVARETGSRVMTSDPEDIARLDPILKLIPC